MDNEDGRVILFTLNRLVVAIDRGLGITGAGAGEFRQACCKKNASLTPFDPEKNFDFFPYKRQFESFNYWCNNNLTLY
jgi:hypothetical protein